MNAIIRTKERVQSMSDKDLIKDWGYVKAENMESNCQDALNVLTEEMKRRGLLD